MIKSESIANRAARIEKARSRSGLTFDEVAAALGVARQTYIDIEKGKRDVKGDMISDISGVLGVSEIWVFNGTGEMVIYDKPRSE